MRIDLSQYRDKLTDLKLLPSRGVIQRVAGLAIEARGPDVGLGQLCEIHLSNGRRVLAEVAGFNGCNRLLVSLEGIEGISPGDAVIARHTPRSIALDERILGRVIDALGRPLDDKGPIEGRDRRSLEASSPPALSRPTITQPLSFGVRSIDGLLTIGRGQRVGIFAGSGVGKSTLLGEIARVSEADVNVLALVGERGREVRHFIEESLGKAGLARSVVLVATADTSPVQRVKAAFTAIAVAEYFRDRGKHVLFMMDSLTRLAMAQREVGLAAGEPPTAKGYCPSVFSLMAKVTERLGAASAGSITGILTILVEGDDLADPVADQARSLLDGHIVLSRALAEREHYPAVDVLQSVSRLMSAVAAPEHRQAAQRLRAILATHRSAEDLINIGAFSRGSNPRIDRAIELIDAANDFLIQPTGQGTPFAQTVARLVEITRAWDFTAAAQPTADVAGR